MNILDHHIQYAKVNDHHILTIHLDDAHLITLFSIICAGGNTEPDAAIGRKADPVLWRKNSAALVEDFAAVAVQAQHFLKASEK